MERYRPLGALAPHYKCTIKQSKEVVGCRVYCNREREKGLYSDLLWARYS